MPPKSADQPAKSEHSSFLRQLATELTTAHAATKGTILRRLNRREYQNTLNDLFGTHLDLENMLPEDGKSHEFDNVGKSLGVSMVHLRQYMRAADKVLDAAIAGSAADTKPKSIVARYQDFREAERFVGRCWKQLNDGSIVRFSGGGYPGDLIRGSRIPITGRYRIRVTGYAYQSAKPITFYVRGISFARGSGKPMYGFYSLPPGKPGRSESIELEAWIERNYMIDMVPYGISDPDGDYKGPGLAIHSVQLEGPLIAEFPSRRHRLVFDGITSTNETVDTSRSLRRVANAAFRRPISNDDVSPYLQLFQAERSGGASFEQSLRTAITAVFCSPRFLYLQEKPGTLDDFAIASRLSYFITRTTPDAGLLSVASSGRLTANPPGLREQTERLLKDPRFERFLIDFTETWPDLSEMDFTVADRRLYPEFDPYLRWSMPRETRAFLKELIASNLPVTNIVKSDFAMLNSRWAEHYGLTPVTGPQLRKVKLPADSVRGGIITRGSVLKVTANGTNTSPVTRGAWIMERILGETPPPPPPGAPGVEPDIRGASTLWQILDKHRSLTACNACHRKIDPPGFALESFNPIGGYRDRYRSLGDGERISKLVDGQPVRYRLGPKVDSSGELPDGGQFDGYKQFRDHLASRKEMLARTLTKKLLTFATGRELGFSDRPEIERIVQAAKAKGYGVRDLIHLAVQGEIFRSK